MSFLDLFKSKCKWFEECENKADSRASNLCKDCYEHRCYVCGKWFYDIENEHPFCNGID